jgi:hypothetical protein
MHRLGEADPGLGFVHVCESRQVARSFQVCLCVPDSLKYTPDDRVCPSISAIDTQEPQCRPQIVLDRKESQRGICTHLIQTGTCQQHTMCSCSPRSDLSRARVTLAHMRRRQERSAKREINNRKKLKSIQFRAWNTLISGGSPKIICTPDPDWYLPAAHHVQLASATRPAPV